MKLYSYEFFFLILTFFNLKNLHARSIDDDIATIRQRILEMVIWPEQSTISHVVQLALEYNRTMNHSCYWEDINYADQTLAVWSTEQHLTRVNIMIQALTVPGSTVQNDTKLSSAAHCALNIWLERDWLNPNWWFNQIGIPLLATGQLLMLGDDVTTFEIEKIKEISFRADWWHHDPGTGANLIWMIQIELYRSLATNNRTGIEQGFTRMWQDIAVLPLGGQGIQTDWSYHFHGTQLLSAAYGQDWLLAMLIFVLSSENTPYELNQQQMIILGKFITEGDAWMIIDNIWEWQVYGRAIDRPETILSVNFQSNWIRSLASLITGDDHLRRDLNDFADRLDRKLDATPLVGNRYFYTSDYLVHRRMNWTSAIKMQSIRTQPTECINDENQQGEHLGQGVLNLYTTNPTDYRDVFPLFDWHMINGITVEYDIPIEKCTRGIFDWIKTDFVGGVTDGNFGTAMMDTATHNLTVKRSWHFYDEAIIALASRLALKTTNSARTTLASRLLPKGNVTVAFFNGTIVSFVNQINSTFSYSNTQSNNVRWIHISEFNVAYLFETQGFYSNIGIEISLKTKSFNTIGPYNNTVTARTLNLWIDHGFGPYSTLNYNYMIIPSVSLDAMPSIIERYASEKIFSCISNNDLFHGSTWPSLQRASFIVWDNITTTYTCSNPSFSIEGQFNNAGAYLYNETSSEFSITVSHPTRINGYLTVNINRTGYGSGCLPLPNGTTNVTVTLPTSGQYLGMSVMVTCQKHQ